MASFRATWKGTVVSVNRARLFARGRFISSPKYRNFVKDMTWTLYSAHLHSSAFPAFVVPVRVRLECSLPSRMDTDNVVKPCLDALQKAGVVANDNLVRLVTADRVGTSKGGRVSQIEFYVEEVDHVE